MPRLSKLLIYVSPLFCLLLLLAAIYLSRQETPSYAEAVRRPPALRLVCERQLYEPATVIIEAFQRRNRLTVELDFFRPEMLEESASLPDGDLYLSIEELPRFCQTYPVGCKPICVAKLRPVVLVPTELSDRIQGWPDLIKPGLRLALAKRKKSTLARSLQKILLSQGISWDDIIDGAVFFSDDCDTLARAVLIGKADSAIIWEPQARLFGGLAAILSFPVEDRHLASVSMFASSTTVKKPERDKLITFFQGELAGSIWQDCKYILPSTDD